MQLVCIILLPYNDTVFISDVWLCSYSFVFVVVVGDGGVLLLLLFLLLFVCLFFKRSGLAC